MCFVFDPFLRVFSAMSEKRSQLSRRRFIKQSALVGGAAAFALRRPLGSLAESKLPPSERINLGFIGLGGMGRNHLQSFSEQPDVHVAGLCDVDRRHLDLAKQKLQRDEVATYGDFRELLADSQIDAVVIATPDHWHGLTSIAAARAGKDVYCEKPLTNSIGEGRAVCQAVAKHNVVLQTGSHERSNSGAHTARQIVEEGRLGKVHTVRIQLPTTEPHLQRIKDFRGTPPTIPVPEEFDYDFWLGHTPTEPYCAERCHFAWRFISNYGGGEMTDRGCHVIDLAQMILGNDATGPTSIQATGKSPEPGLYDAILDFDFENQFADGLRMIGNNDSPRGLWLEGTEGKLFVAVHGAKLTAEPASLLDDLAETKSAPYASHRREFLDAIKSRGSVVAPAEAGHRTATICHLNNLAMRLGRSFNWDPETERADDDEVNALLTPNMRAPWSLDV